MSATRRAPPPGPRGHPLIGSLPEFRRDILGFLTQCAREYGDVVAFRVFHIRCCLVNHPDLIEQVLVREQDRTIKNWDARQLKVALGDGLLTNEGDAWRGQRRLIQPAFHNDAIRRYAEIMVRNTGRMLASWRDGEVRDLQADLMAVTLEIVAEALFGVDLAPQSRLIGPALGDVMEWFERVFTGGLPLPLWIPTPANLKMRRAIGRFDALVSSFIRQRRASPVRGSDLLSSLLAATDEAGAGMTDRQLRDEVMTLLLAGHETTALALSWTWHLLGQHPKVEQQLHAELDRVLEGRAPAVSDLPMLTYAERVIKESMRLYPPAWSLARTVIKEFEIGGYRIPAGANVVMSQWIMQRDPRYFSDPDKFDPDRWLLERSQKLPRFAYFPFGGGARQCIGGSFAMMEAVLLLATIAQRFQFKAAPGHPVTAIPSFTLRPKHGIRMILQKRAAARITVTTT